MEPEQQPQTSSPSKLVIILLILIVSAGGYLAYAIYNESTKNPSETAIESAPVQPMVDENISIPSQDPVSDSEKMDTNYTLTEVEENRTPASCWTIIDGSVYNITSYIPNHPGGPAEISQICGRDGSELFAKPAQHVSGGAKDILAQFEIGKLVQ